VAIDLIYEVSGIGMVVAVYLVGWLYCGKDPDGAG
jgi:hypothetical protein